MEAWLAERGLRAAARSGLDYFFSYIAIETRADAAAAEAGQRPSSPGQRTLAEMIVADLAALDVAAEVDDYGHVMARIPTRVPADEGAEALPVLGLIAHLDTATEMSGRATGARIVRYEGRPIVLNEAAVAADEGTAPIVLDESLAPELSQYVGQELVVTDGSTLLGADDKAGVAAIMSLIALLRANPELPHGELAIAFTSDEEIGRGAEGFDIARFGADVAYTIDGGRAGELEGENFNAAAARVVVHGRSVHPGGAKGRMRNAVLLARRYSLAFPDDETPETTEGREGFWHLMNVEGDVERCQLDYIVRDFDREAFERRKQRMRDEAEALNRRYGETVVEVELRDQYYNMAEPLRTHPELLNLAREAIRDLGLEPREHPIRGGTDGAQLSYRGLPCPNLFTGGANAHGRFEYLKLEDFALCQRLLIRLVELFADPTALARARAGAGEGRGDA